jgi:pimeloyl-ACP methyl ester carboxylesterase
MPRLYYVHGSGFTEDSFREQVRAFPESVALSLPGHPQGVPLDSVGAMADWLHQRVSPDGRAVVAGNSLGGAIALEWASRYPQDVAGLILIGTGARLRVSPAIFELIEQWPDSISKLVDFSVSPTADANLRGRVDGWHRTVGQRATRMDYTACNDWDMMDRVAQIKFPTLIIVGELDKLTPPKFARFLNENIACSRLLEVSGAGHIAMAERPDIVNPVIGDFLASLEAN